MKAIETKMNEGYKLSTLIALVKDIKAIDIVTTTEISQNDIKLLELSLRRKLDDYRSSTRTNVMMIHTDLKEIDAASYRLLMNLIVSEKGLTKRMKM